MVPPAVVRLARQLWWCQWHQLMGGLGPADNEGNYRRPTAAFAAAPPLPADAAEAGGHALIVGRSCPWAHRAWLTWSLRQLAPSIELVLVEPDPQAGRWRFTQPFVGCHTLAELYLHSGADRGLRATVPVLYSHRQERLLLGESARLIEWLNQWPAGPAAPDLAPVEREPAIRHWRDLLQHDVNDGVYRCGFARNQAAFDRAETALFAGLDALETQLEHQAAAAEDWLCSPAPSLADVQLFPTLIRLEIVYAPLFGCRRRPLTSYSRLLAWRARFHQLPGVAATCCEQAWRQDYFGALFPLHPSGIVPSGPDLASLIAPQPPP
ncbi:MAG: glutathione S-transferase C-terminal domain-containing protein [Cyanobacteriota bacterium]|nr:glutathione S-transferase C-terminal domain-containing protein [Cyanobacteriota bacterium]